MSLGFRSVGFRMDSFILQQLVFVPRHKVFGLHRILKRLKLYL